MAGVPIFVRGISEVLGKMEQCAAYVKAGDRSRRNVAAYLFFELRCPFCARLITSPAFDYLVNLVDTGFLSRLVMVDRLIHRQGIIEDVHASIRCRQGDARLEFIRDRMSALLRGRLPMPDECDFEKYKEEVRNCDQLSIKADVAGTPTTIIYDFEKDVGYVIEGFSDPVSFSDLVLAAVTRLVLD